MNRLLADMKLALAMLLHNRRRLAISFSAVAFTVVILFMEMGFFNGINDSQSLLATLFDADLVMMDHKSIHLNKYAKMDRSWLMKALGFEGVREVVPVYKSNVEIRNPTTKLTKIVLVLAFPADTDALKTPGLKEGRTALLKRGTLLFDRKSRSIYGHIERGQILEIEGHKMRVGGFFEMGPDFSNDGTIIMSDKTWLAGRPPFQITYGLVRAEPGTDIEALRQRLRKALPEEVLIMTPEEIRKREVLHTIKAVPLGAVFGVGMIIGFVIGVIICYQILFNEITDHLPEFATLRAMGFADGFLRRVVVQEAVWLSLSGFTLGLAVSHGIYFLIERYTGILMRLTFGRGLLIMVFTTAMCVVGALLAVKRVTEADPADLY